MSFDVGSLIGAGINFVGGLIQQNSQQQMAEDQRASEWRASNVQMDFQREMSGSAHQREIKDLKAAGLNPILSGTGGMGSTTPGGAKGSFGMGLPPPNLTEGPVAAYQALRRNKAEVENIQTDTRKKWAEGTLNSQLFNQSQEQTELLKSQYRTQEELTRAAESQASILASQAKGFKLEGNIDETKYGEMMRFIDRAVKSLRGSAGAYRDIR